MSAEQVHPAPDRGSTAEELLAAVRFGIPGLAASHVRRPRLLEALAPADSPPLVLVSGPAGSGKTSLVAEWVRAGGRDAPTTGWVTFEDGESIFWEHVLECLRRLGLEVPAWSAGGTTGSLLGRRRLLTLAATVAEARQPWTVVLDGYEMLSLELAHEVDFLLRHTAGRLRLVFVGRVDPVLPLYRYRLEDSLVEVRAADLAFTDAEASRLLEGLGVGLAPALVHEVNERVKGWAAGLRFAARALVGHPDPVESVLAVVSQTGDINEYLLGEVLDAQPPDTRRFLLETSLPDILCAGLVEEMSGPRAARMLHDVAKANAFIEPVPERPGFYRYYPFFRELLKAQLAYESPDAVVGLHRSAAHWLRCQGLAEKAIGHLAAISDWEGVAGELVDGHMLERLLYGPPGGRLGEVARQMPGGVHATAACVVRAAVALADGDTATCAEELAAARRDPDTRPDGTVDRSVVALDALRASLADDAKAAAEVAVDAERMLYGGQPRPGAAPEPPLYAVVQQAKGLALLRCGDLRAARRTLAVAAGTELAGTIPAFRARCLGYLAVVDVMEGSLARARRRALESSSKADETDQSSGDRPATAQVALACVALEQYELRAAHEYLASATAGTSLRGDPVAWSLKELVVAGLERAGGHLNAALARLDAGASDLGDTDPWLADCLRVEAARLSVASGQSGRALRELDQLGEREGPDVAVVAAAAYTEQGREPPADESLALALRRRPALRTQVSGMLVQVLQDSRRPDPARARATLARSLRLAAPEELRRPFHEAGPAVQRILSADPVLLQQHQWLNHSGPVPGPVDHARRLAPPQETDTGADVVEALTAKETEVLCHLQELLTTEEIAEKMFVSVNTVRTHVRNILRKLGVTRRNAAVRKARELGLFGG